MPGVRSQLSQIDDYPAFLEAAWQQHLAPRQSDAPTVISTFAGAGGSSLGYSMAGYRELLAVEWDDNAVEAFRIGVRGDLGIAPSHPKAESKTICALCAVEGIADKVANPAGQRAFNVAQRKLLHHKPAPTLDANALVPGGAAPFDLTGVRIGAERYAVIGSFPSAFEFAGTWKNKLVRIGNSVPPLFMRAIARHIRETVLMTGQTPVLVADSLPDEQGMNRE